jgi:preprotein translocase subunit SecD
VSAATTAVEPKAKPQTRTPEEISSFFVEKAKRDNDAAIEAAAAIEREHRAAEAAVECATIETSEEELRQLVSRRDILAMRVGHARIAQTKTARAIETAERESVARDAAALRKLRDKLGVEPILALEAKAAPMRAELARIEAEQRRIFAAEVRPRQPYFERLMPHQIAPDGVLEDVEHIRRVAGFAAPLSGTEGMHPMARDAMARRAIENTVALAATPATSPADLRTSESDFGPEDKARLRFCLKVRGAAVFNDAGCPFAVPLMQAWRLAGGAEHDLTPIGTWTMPDVDVTSEWLHTLLTGIREGGRAMNIATAKAGAVFEPANGVSTRWDVR